MKSKRLSQIFKSEYTQTIILVAVLFVGIFAFWFGLKFALQTEFPMLAVASGSMEPTLYRGDLIIVQGGLNFAELHVGFYRLPNGTLNPTPGEIIVYYDPRHGKDPNHLIVHRAVEKYQHENGTWFFYTKGDYRSGLDHDPWTEPYGLRQDYIVGKVIGKVPLVGHIPLFMRTQTGILLIIFLFIILILVDLFVPSKRKEKVKDAKEKL